ncbi:hypothetical protein BDY21DRAFT_290437 [Lineolata rhizophorae]|uniref:Rhodopsin domain-containing protein n=1 Tax=Lineolata rhizophorae TaxID=578093 RepID=A0A6A6NTV1_9PEZI|nr:hypothetical protein BDY21DRAFT_290437 [Lineolata rhizophorae]
MSGLPERAQQVIACAASTVIISGIMVVLRFFTRTAILHSLGWEDWLILVSLVGSLQRSKYLMCTLASYQRDMTLPAYRTNSMQAMYATILLYGMSLTFAKLSILLQYLRIFSVMYVRKVCYIQLGIVTAYGAWLFFCSLLSCVPIEKNWDDSVDGGCIPTTEMWFANAGINIVTDFMIVLVPMWPVRKLKLPKRQKIILAVVFAVGFLACIVSILRLYSLYLATISDDSTYDNIGVAIWSCLEINAAILCASVPTIKPLVSRLFPRLLSNSSRSRTMYNTRANGGQTGNTNLSGNRLRGASQNPRRVGADTESNKGIMSAEVFSLEQMKNDDLELERKYDNHHFHAHVQGADPNSSGSLSDTSEGHDGSGWRDVEHGGIRVERTVKQTVDHHVP